MFHFFVIMCSIIRGVRAAADTWCTEWHPIHTIAFNTPCHAWVHESGLLWYVISPQSMCYEIGDGSQSRNKCWSTNSIFYFYLCTERWRRSRRRWAWLFSSSKLAPAELLPGAVRDRPEPRADDPDLVGSADAGRISADRASSFLGHSPRHGTQLHCRRGSVARRRGRRRRTRGVRKWNRYFINFTRHSIRCVCMCAHY